MGFGMTWIRPRISFAPSLPLCPSLPLLSLSSPSRPHPEGGGADETMLRVPTPWWDDETTAEDSEDAMAARACAHLDVPMRRRRSAVERERRTWKKGGGMGGEGKPRTGRKTTRRTTCRGKQEDHAERVEKAASSPLPPHQIDEKLFTTLKASRRVRGVPLYVMLPLDTVTVANTLSHVKALHAALRALRSVGVDGVMVDVWWGIVEAAGPTMYNWSAYKALVRMVASVGMRLQVVMSFHACGCNVGDSCVVSLPPWVLSVAEDIPDVLYTDRHGNRNTEYLSLGVDEVDLFYGRTPLEMYRDMMQSFKENFHEYLGTVITEVEVSLGPAGELRYPSYPREFWRFPGIGEFQCYDKFMLAHLKAAAEREGHSEWGHGGPHDAGDFNKWPEETGFFKSEHGSWNTPYGHFFLKWYSEMLIAHGDRVLSLASEILSNTGTVLAAKLPGIHWWYKSRSHAAELTAGIYNTRDRDGYKPVMNMLAKHDALLNFTCAEMRDSEQPVEAMCGPEGLLMQVRQAASEHSVAVAAENALMRLDRSAYDQIIRNSYHSYSLSGDPLPNFVSFTFLRMHEALFEPSEWKNFVHFVTAMDAEGEHAPLRTTQSRDVEHESGVEVDVGSKDDGLTIFYNKQNQQEELGGGSWTSRIRLESSSTLFEKRP